MEPLARPATFDPWFAYYAVWLFSASAANNRSEWFYVGLADLTLGSRTGTKHIEDVAPGEYDGVYDKGRVAFYLKGKIKGSWLLTAAADTREIAEHAGPLVPRTEVRNARGVVHVAGEDGVLAAARAAAQALP